MNKEVCKQCHYKWQKAALLDNGRDSLELFNKEFSSYFDNLVKRLKGVPCIKFQAYDFENGLRFTMLNVVPDDCPYHLEHVVNEEI